MATRHHRIEKPGVPADDKQRAWKDAETNESTTIFLGYTSNLISSGLRETLRFIYETEGVGGFFVGLQPQLIKAVSNAALMLAIKEKSYGLVKALVMPAPPVKIA